MSMPSRVRSASRSVASIRISISGWRDRNASSRGSSHLWPIDGLVLTRHVEAGQAVSSGMNTPQLFTLATSLKDMRLELNIDEADVGKIKPGQKAVFTVDAYAGKKFSAEFIKLRYAPQRVQGVVTYVGIFSVNNSGLLLRPGMTAAAKVEIEQVSNKLIVPNGALRFYPVDAVPEDVRHTPSPQNANVWVLRDGVPQKVSVRKGGSNGRFTEIVDGKVSPGDLIVLSRVEVQAENNILFSIE